MPNESLINVNGSGGAFTDVPATGGYHYAQIVEDASVTQQGLEVKFPRDGFTATFTYAAGQPIELFGNGYNGALGMAEQGTAGAFNHRAADVMCQVRSATATSTTIRVVEEEQGPQ